MTYEIVGNIRGGGGGRTRRYRQGRGRRRYRQGHGKKMQAFKCFAKKGLNFTRKHVLPHLAEVGSNVLMDALEGKNIGQSIRQNSKMQARTAVSGMRRRRRRQHMS